MSASGQVVNQSSPVQLVPACPVGPLVYAHGLPRCVFVIQVLIPFLTNRYGVYGRDDVDDDVDCCIKAATM